MHVVPRLFLPVFLDFNFSQIIEGILFALRKAFAAVDYLFAYLMKLDSESAPSYNCAPLTGALSII